MEKVSFTFIVPQVIEINAKDPCNTKTIFFIHLPHVTDAPAFYILLRSVC